MLVVGGVAFDGTVLPLPAGVDQTTVDSGGLELVVHVSPRLPDLTSGPTGAVLFVPAECRVDADRRVTCWGQWITISGLESAAASCDFLVIAAVPGGPDGRPHPRDDMLHLETGHVLAVAAVGTRELTVDELTGSRHLAVRRPGSELVVEVAPDLLTAAVAPRDDDVLDRPLDFRVGRACHP